MADALPLFDRALTVTQADPALTDLRLLLQVNKAVTLGDLDQYDGAFAAARQAQQLADRAGIMVRRAQAHSCLGQLLFHTGRWDDALAEVGVAPGSQQGPRRGLLRSRRRRRDLFPPRRRQRGPAATSPPPPRTPSGSATGWSGPLALARSQALEQAGALTEALGVLTGFADHAEEVDEVEDLLADGVRLATKVGDTAAAQTLADRAVALAQDTEIPHRQANALYCRGLVDRDAGRLLRAADRYRDARRPLPGAKALEAAAGTFVDTATGTRPGRRSPGRWTSTPRSARPVMSPGCRPGSGPTASAGPRGSSTGGPGAAGTA